jgi:hypothetical protein
MLHRLRPRSAYDVIALLALCIAVGTGGAYAANTIRSEDIVDGEVKNADIGANAMTSSKLANGSVQNADLGPDAVTTSKIKAGNVGATDLAANAVTGAKVADGSLTGDDIAESSLGEVPQAENAENADNLDGFDAGAFLGAADTATNSDLLDGRDSKGFARLGGVVQSDGTVFTGTGFTVNHPDTGTYEVVFPAGTLSNELCPPIAAVMTFSAALGQPELTGRLCSGLGAGSFTIRMVDGAGVPHNTPFTFMAM